MRPRSSHVSSARSRSGRRSLRQAGFGAGNLGVELADLAIDSGGIAGLEALAGGQETVPPLSGVVEDGGDLGGVRRMNAAWNWALSRLMALVARSDLIRSSSPGRGRRHARRSRRRTGRRVLLLDVCGDRPGLSTSSAWA